MAKLGTGLTTYSKIVGLLQIKFNRSLVIRSGTFFTALALIFLSTWYASGWNYAIVFQSSDSVNRPWQFFTGKMLIPLTLWAILCSISKPFRSAILVACATLLLGEISATKALVLREPIRYQDLSLIGQGWTVRSFASYWLYIYIAAVICAAVFYLFGARLSTRRGISFGACLIFLVGWRSVLPNPSARQLAQKFGVFYYSWSLDEDLKFNGLLTHLFITSQFSPPHSFSDKEIDESLKGLAKLDPAPKLLPPHSLPDIYIVLGESWWGNKFDKHSPLNRISDVALASGTLNSPVYGGGTANCEFSALTSVPMSSFPAATIPYVDYRDFFRSEIISLPRTLSSFGYVPRAFHNFRKSFWNRNLVYPALGFQSFTSLDDMNPEDGRYWPRDSNLHKSITDRALLDSKEQRLVFAVTVSTHGPFLPRVRCPEFKNSKGYCDFRGRLDEAVEDFLEFHKAIEREGRDYLMIVFGDHLPYLPAFQNRLGLFSDDELTSKGNRNEDFKFSTSFSQSIGSWQNRVKPWKEVPVFALASPAVRNKLGSVDFERAPVFCAAPLLLTKLGIQLPDPYFEHVSAKCLTKQYDDIKPSEPILYRQLFYQDHE